MDALILCGGLGTRLREETEFRPKPMVEVGGKPILWHIMMHYRHHGVGRFVLCLGEATCLGAGVQNARVARLSNVFGDDTTSSNFLTSVMRDAVEKGSVHLATSLASEKDYVWIGDVVAALEALATRGSEKIVNVAGGVNTTHRAIMAALSAATGCDVQVVPHAPALSFPPISTKRLNQLNLGPRVSLTSMLGDLVALFANRSDRSIATGNARRANPPQGPD